MALADNQAVDFNDLLAAVQESKRGRWFLDEYGARLRKAETGSILQAIAKLEQAMAGAAPHGDSALLAKARAAIAAARRDIATLEGAPAELSAEGRLFAKLADMARASFAAEGPAPAAVTAGVGRALQLVDDLETSLAVPVAAAKPQADYFSSDQDVFATPQVEAKALPASTGYVQPQPQAGAEPAKTFPTPPALKEPVRGAKLVVRKAETAGAPAPAAAASSVTEPIAAEAVAAVAPAPEAVPVAPSPVAVAATEKNARVVIIRRKPEELMAVPLPDEAESAA